MTQKLTSIIQGSVSGETSVKPKQRKRLSITAYRERCRKGWETRKRQAAAREDGKQQAA